MALPPWYLLDPAAQSVTRPGAAYAPAPHAVMTCDDDVNNPPAGSLRAEVAVARRISNRMRAPVGRIGRLDNIARAIVFLVGNRFMTGSVIDCDGGMRMVGRPL